MKQQKCEPLPTCVKTYCDFEKQKCSENENCECLEGRQGKECSLIDLCQEKKHPDENMECLGVLANTNEPIYRCPKGFSISGKIIQITNCDLF